MLREFNPQEALNQEKQALNMAKQEAETGRKLLEEVGSFNMPKLPGNPQLTN